MHRDEGDSRKIDGLGSIATAPVRRRSFLKYACLVGAVVSLGVLVGVAAACGSSSSSSGSSPAASSGGAGDVWKLGVVADLSGGLAAAGADVRDGAQLLVDQYNAAGGVKGPDGKMHQFELVVEDGGMDTGRSTAAFNKLIMNDKVTGLMGPLWGNEVPSAQAIVERAQIPALMASTPQPSTMDKGYKWSFMLAFSPQLMAQTEVATMQLIGATKVVAISDNEGFMQGSTDFVKDYLPKDGSIQYVIVPDTFTAGDVNLSAQAQKLKAQADQIGADALVINTDGMSAIPLIKAYHALGGDLAIIGNGAFANDAVITAGGKDVEGVYVPTPPVLNATALPDAVVLKPIEVKFVTDFKAKYGHSPSAFAANTYSAMGMWKEAFAAVGADKAKLNDYLSNMTNFMGPSGIYDWKATHNGESIEGQVIYQIKNGVWVPVAWLDKSGTPTKI